MKTSISLLLLALVQNSLCNVVKRRTSTTACNANNCLRGIRGTGSNIKPPLTYRLSDCSSFMRATVTPAPTTTTITIATVTTTVVPLLPRELEARQQTTSPSQVPAYATFCAASSAYSSGCSCLGITKSTLTVATPTLTEYATATSTIIPCRPGVPSCNSKCVDLNTDDANCGSCGNITQVENLHSANSDRPATKVLVYSWANLDARVLVAHVEVAAPACVILT
ncbi:hypothetical protein BKA65DRAFT_554635 [Rhexocercosporidium sp. MPI-PUGE-AT-0058]|nr:hypothetical protein BKA65DRAFT_554635 [Rhexocercosporidium sp. MPI-PUGE-AT-0058]